LTSVVYTIGYATKPIDTFCGQLQNYGVTVVADVRSVPYSKAFYDFHQEALQAHLRKVGIRYVYLGAELGPRSKELTHYNEQKQVQFDRLMQSTLFNSGIVRLQAGLNKGFRIALCCAEKDPAICHRSLLIGWALFHCHQIEVQHIDHEGNRESESALEHRLLQLTATQQDMLIDDAGELKIDYQKQLRAWR